MHKQSVLWPGVLRRTATCCAAVLLACCAIRAQAPARPQTLVPTVRRAAFRAVSYDVSASLSPADQTLSARATVEFESRELSRTVECELHANLRVSDVLDAAGKPVSFERDDFNQLVVRVSLPDPVPAGQRTKLTFVYAGPLANEENSPVRGLRLAWIGNEGAYLLLPARWFPLTEYPSNRYTGVFHIEVPQNFAVAGTGVAEAPSAVAAKAAATPMLGNRNPRGAGASSAPPPAPAPRMTYTFRTDRPEAAGTFVAGTLQLLPVKAEGVTISVYAPPDASNTAQPYGEAVARMIGVFSDQFGPLVQPNLAVAQIPDGTLAAFAAPGLLLVSQRQWSAAPNTRVLSNLVAAQWWGDQVMAASPSDAWLTDGLARYSEALYVEQTASKDSMDRTIDDFAVGALMYEGAAPIAEAGRLAAFSPEYESVVINKGATVFHMLRGQLGDAAFLSLLRDFSAQFSGKSASLSDFERMAEARAGGVNVGPAAPTTEETSSSSSGPPVLKHVPAASEEAAAPVIGNAPQAADSDSGSLNLRPFFAQWLNSTGVPEFTVDYTVFRTKGGFRIVGKVKQNLDFFRMPVEVEVQTEGNPEFKSIQITGKESDFELEVFGRPKSGGILLDPHNYILKSSERLHVRSIIARGEALAEQSQFYDAIQQYSQALDLQRNNSLADFRMGEAFFYQKNYSAAANAFRDALDGDLDPSYKWVEVWSHIYLGKIYDTSGDRTRAVNEYSKAEQTNDDTGGAQAEAKTYIAKAYTEGASQAATSPGASSASPSASPRPSANPSPSADSGSDRPVLKRKDQ